MVLYDNLSNLLAENLGVSNIIVILDITIMIILEYTCVPLSFFKINP